VSRQPIDQQITFLYTRDLESTTRFYEHVVGLDLVLDQGDCRIYRTAQDAYIGFCRRETTAKPAGVILTLVSQQVDEWYAELHAKGVSFEHPPRLNEEYQIYHCFLRDPNGYLIEIQRFEDPGWSQPTIPAEP